MKRSISFVLAMLLLGLASCGGTDTPGTDTTGGDTTPADTTAAGYDYSKYDFGGYEFNVLNFESIWSCYVHLDFAEQTGEMLDDAVFKRNSKVEEALNIKFNEVEEKYTAFNTGHQAMCDLVIQSVMAGDQAYDAAYLPVAFKPGTITEGYLLDLYDVPGLQLDKPWWDIELNKSMELNGHLYTASSPLNLFSMDMADVLLFNKQLFTDNKVTFPYEAVNGGTWTIDAMNTMISQIANLNGDENFNVKADGKAVYGIAGHNDFPIAFMLSAGNRLLTAEKDGSFTINIESERWINSMEKLSKLFDGTSGNAFFRNSSGEDNYEKMFARSRAAFITCEMKTVTVLRSTMDTAFGLIPMPKYDEEQENYWTAVSYNTSFLTVPKIQSDAERTGVILDALSYESMQSTLPVYNDISLTQKGLRDEESAEMLALINEYRAVEFPQLFGITNDYVTAANNEIKKTDPAGASLAATHLPAIKANIEKVLGELE